MSNNIFLSNIKDQRNWKMIENKWIVINIFINWLKSQWLEEYPCTKNQRHKKDQTVRLFQAHWIRINHRVPELEEAAQRPPGSIPSPVCLSDSSGGRGRAILLDSPFLLFCCIKIASMSWNHNNIQYWTIGDMDVHYCSWLLLKMPIRLVFSFMLSYKIVTLTVFVIDSRDSANPQNMSRPSWPSWNNGFWTTLQYTKETDILFYQIHLLNKN
jgi:hypothetical protein